VTRTVTVGTAADLAVRTVLTGLPTWCGVVPELPSRFAVQMRAHGEAVPARVEAAPGGGGLLLGLESATRGIAPGQTAALYDDERVVGSATIERTDGGGPTGTSDS
jgi:tRNA-uridine 2-sulfurtransferase